MEALAAQARAWSSARLCCTGPGAVKSRIVVGGMTVRGCQVNRGSSLTHNIIVSNGRKSIKFGAGALPEGASDGKIIIIEAVMPGEEPKEPYVFSEETAAEEDTGQKTKVTFTLKKEISYGQTFSVVGGIPQLGEWDPAAAVPMVWTDDHTWMADVAIPVGQSVEYKIILTGKGGEQEWQPGENRHLETVDASDMVAEEYWDGTEPDESVDVKEAIVDNESLGEVSDGVVNELNETEEQAPEVLGESADDAVSELKEVTDDDTNEQLPERSEVPFLDVALATAVGEVRAKVADMADAEE